MPDRPDDHVIEVEFETTQETRTTRTTSPSYWTTARQRVTDGFRVLGRGLRRLYRSNALRGLLLFCLLAAVTIGILYVIFHWDEFQFRNSVKNTQSNATVARLEKDVDSAPSRDASTPPSTGATSPEPLGDTNSKPEVVSPPPVDPTVPPSASEKSMAELRREHREKVLKLPPLLDPPIPAPRKSLEELREEHRKLLRQDN